MTQLQEALEHTDSSPPDVVTAARSSMSRLLERLLHQSDARPRPTSCAAHQWTLADRLSHGLTHLNTRQQSGKSLVASLQQHFLVFTQRLHSAEVERRSLRLELVHQKRLAGHAPPSKDPCDLVPGERFQRVCMELREALLREQQAQRLLQDQARQLEELGTRMDTHTHQDTDRQHTLCQAVQSLSEAKQEVRRKDQSLRILGKRVSALQQERRGLEGSLRQAEEALHTAVRSRDSLASYMRTAESSYKEVRDQILQSQASPSGQDRPLLLPRVHLELPGQGRIVGGQEVVACQSLLATVSELCQAACSRIGALEQEVSAHRDHVSALRMELKDACLRENMAFVPVTEGSVTPDLEAPPHDSVRVLLRETQSGPAPSGPAPTDPPRAAEKPPKKTRTRR